MKTDENSPVEVFSGTEWEAGLVKSLLENAEIEVFFNHEIVGNMSGGAPNPFVGGEVSLVVPFHEFEKAKQVVDDYLNKTQENNTM